MRRLFLSLTLLLIPISVFPAAGDLDTTFGTGGLVTSAPSGGSDRARDIALQPDGKMVITGWLEPGGVGPQMFVARYNADGTLDGTFGSGGFVFAQADTRGWEVAVQPDGKIVVAGTQFIGANSDTCIWRFNSDGTPDLSFNGTGRRVTTISFFYRDELYAVSLQADGKIVAAGTARHDDNPNQDFLVMRFTPDGGLDNTWDGDGMAFTAMDVENDTAWSLAIQPDGKIVLAGEGGISSTQFSLAVARYNSSDGSLDASFDGDGKLLRNFGGTGIAHSVALQPDGKVVIGGQIGGLLSILRFNANGTTDSSFDTDGQVSYGFTDSRAEAILLQPDGKIVAVGHGSSGTGRFFALVRALSDGMPDTTFGPDGFFVTTSFGPGTFASAEAAAIQPNGNIVAAGYVNGGPYVSHDIALARYLNDLAPTAARVSIGGRVMDADGLGLARVRVSLADASGMSRSTMTNNFGYFRFEDIEVGQTCLISSSHKSYTFEPRTLQVFDEVTDLIITPSISTKLTSSRAIDPR